MCSDPTFCQNGVCDSVAGTCTCYASWTGANCDEYNPPEFCTPDPCSNHGKCDNTDGTCRCDLGWSGTNCSTPPGAPLWLCCVALGGLCQAVCCSRHNNRCCVLLPTRAQPSQGMVLGFLHAVLSAGTWVCKPPLQSLYSLSLSPYSVLKCLLHLCHCKRSTFIFSLFCVQAHALVTTLAVAMAFVTLLGSVPPASQGKGPQALHPALQLLIDWNI